MDGRGRDREGSIGVAPVHHQNSYICSGKSKDFWILDMEPIVPTAELERALHVLSDIVGSLLSSRVGSLKRVQVAAVMSQLCCFLEVAKPEADKIPRMALSELELLCIVSVMDNQ